MVQEQQFCHYFVDEAGDPTLFDKKGNVSDWHTRLFALFYAGPLTRR